ncbi:MAG TPA: T9SS type A sorting domain-containing protein [Bacteroidia bacterium]|jgi:hypothetical protein|nr:T9SS type A sorting domain-containing protein [Bacteroidia bacterium]
MKKLFTILTAAFVLNVNAQTTTTFARNGLAAVDTSGTGTSGSNAQCFRNAVNYPAHIYVSSIITADFNNDGKADLATANTGVVGSNDVSILLGTGTGTFGATTNFPIGISPGSPSNFGSICSADFNNDGFKDIAVTNVGYDTAVFILLGTGTGSFGTSTYIHTASNSPYALVSADFNMDGKADLVVGASNSNYVFLFLGTGTGSFGAATNFTVGVNPRSIISADFNGDAKLDLAVANAGSSNVSILLGNGTGSFSAAANFPSITTPLSIITIDFNNDGKLDLAAANGFDTVSVLLGTGTGSFGAPVSTYYPNGNVGYQTQIVSADFNGDGIADVATPDYGLGSGYASVLLGTGTGSFSFDANFATGSNPFGIVTADFNMDGKPDLATANESSNNVSILLNSPTHTISIAATATTLCSGNSTTLTASGSSTYIWSTSATTSTISVAPTGTTIYSVNDGVGCSNTDSITIKVATTDIPNICMVTTDSASNYNYNMIVWDKTPYNNVDSFIVYRYDVMSSSYLRIGAVSQNSLSEFRDTSFSIGGPNGGNPLYSSWLYKLAIRDTCGNIGAKSSHHQSMFVQESGSTFSWNAYVGASVTGYSFLRDDNNTGAWHVLVNTAGLSSTDPNYASYPNGNWRVDALGFNCTPTMRLAAGNNNNTSVTNKKSHSNTSKPTAVGMNQISNNNAQIKIYPNPSTNNITIQSSTELGAITIYNSLGEIVSQTKSKNTQEQIDMNKFSSGIYIVLTQSRYIKLIKE